MPVEDCAGCGPPLDWTTIFTRTKLTDDQWYRLAPQWHSDNEIRRVVSGPDQIFYEQEPSP